MADFDLVIFDFDGVIVDSEVISAQMLIAELKHYGVNVDGAYVARHFLGRSYPVVLQQIRDEFGVALPDGFEVDYRARLLAAFEQNLTAMPGIKGVLDQIRTPYCVATSSSPVRLKSSLQVVGLTSYFEGRFHTASEVARGKPAPDLFLHVAQRYGVAPARCLVIEDSLAGVRAGLAAGMVVWRFVGGSHLTGLELPTDTGAQPHRMFDRFDDLFELAPELKDEME
ncbi:HAD family hydrolase [Celeribacter sp.]|uniref:HAD family hydrolase n=1 Tax=Celeribacter sp. TaxID=1890673 RepID=UPI003A954DAF